MPKPTHADATRRHEIIDRHNLTTTNSQGQRVLNTLNDTQAKWEAAQRDVCAAEEKEVKYASRNGKSYNKLRIWYLAHPNPPSLDNIVCSNMSVADAKAFLRNYQQSFINITNITDNITLPNSLHKSWKNELSQHNNEACNLLRFLKNVFGNAATADDKRAILKELKTEFGIMTPTEFDAKYKDSIESANRFQCFGDMNWKAVLFLQHVGLPLAEKDKPYPPLEDAKKAFQSVVDRPEYELIKALVYDEAHRQRSIVQKGLEAQPFYEIVKPYRDTLTVNSEYAKHQHYHRAKGVIAENNSNLHCATDCPHCALFRRRNADDTASADDTTMADDTDVSTSVEQDTTAVDTSIDTTEDTAETAVSRDVTAVTTATDELQDEYTDVSLRPHPRLAIMFSTIQHDTETGKKIKKELEKKHGKEGWRRTWERLLRQIPHCVLRCIMLHMQEDKSEVYQYLEGLDEDESDVGESTWATRRRLLLHHRIRMELHKESEASCFYSDLPLNMFPASSTVSHHVFKHFMVWLMMPGDQPDIIIDTRKIEGIAVIIRTATSFMDLIQRYARDSTLCVEIFGLDHNFWHWLEEHPKLVQKLGFELPKCVTVNKGKEEATFMVLSLDSLPTVKSLVDECSKNEKKLTDFDRVELAPGKADQSIPSDYGIKKLVGNDTNTIDRYFLPSRDEDDDEDDKSTAVDLLNDDDKPTIDSFDDDDEEEKTPKVKSSSAAVTESDRPTKKAKKEEEEEGGSGSDDDEEMEGSDDEEMEVVQRVVKVNPSANGDDEGAEDSNESNEDTTEPEEDTEGTVADVCTYVQSSLSFTIPSNQMDGRFPGIDSLKKGSGFSIWKSVDKSRDKAGWDRMWTGTGHGRQEFVNVVKGVILADGGWDTKEGWDKVADDKALRDFGWNAYVCRNVYLRLFPIYKRGVLETLERLKPKKKTE